MKALTAILLAAGDGTRMMSKKQKVMHQLCGRPVIGWVMRSVQRNIVERPVTVLGFDGESVQEYFGKDSAYVYQAPGDSTAEALRAGLSAVSAQDGYVLVIAGNLPLISDGTVSALVSAARKGAASRLICLSEDVTLIVAAYCFELKAIRACLERSFNTIEQCVSCLRAEGNMVVDVYAPEIEGLEVDTREGLWCCSEIMRRTINSGHMDRGVTFIDPNSAYIDADVRIGMDTVIYPNVQLMGNTVIGENCTLYSGCRMENSRIGNDCTLDAVVAIDAEVEDGARVGPFVRLRPNSHIGAGCKIGNFVEVKNSTVGEKTSIAHLTYVGDADVGSRVNMGCGTVFVNYDGFKKHRTTVGDNVFLGCQTALVAPVNVGNDVYTGAGSVITEDIPDGALAIARSHQQNKDGWVEKYREKKKK